MMVPNDFHKSVSEKVKLYVGKDEESQVGKLDLISEQLRIRTKIISRIEDISDVWDGSSVRVDEANIPNAHSWTKA